MMFGLICACKPRLKNIRAVNVSHVFRFVEFVALLFVAVASTCAFEFGDHLTLRRDLRAKAGNRCGEF